jgi:hypothetical protein
MEVDSIEEYRQKYPDEWVVVEIEEEDGSGRIKRSSILGHSRDREEMERIMFTHKGYTYIFFTGPVVPEGHAIAV